MDVRDVGTRVSSLKNTESEEQTIYFSGHG